MSLKRLKKMILLWFYVFCNALQINSIKFYRLQELTELLGMFCFVSPLSFSHSLTIPTQQLSHTHQYFIHIVSYRREKQQSKHTLLHRIIFGQTTCKIRHKQFSFPHLYISFNRIFT